MFSIGEAAELLGVSADTMRRWVAGGRLDAERNEHDHRVIAGTALARPPEGAAVLIKYGFQQA